MPVKKGDKIKVEYTGTFDDGTVFDSSEKHGKPLEFEVGAGQIIKGFDEALIGMETDQEKDIHLEPANAYGDPNPDLVKKVPKEQLPKDQELKPGMVLVMALPNGMQIPAKITDINDTEATLDLNHPMAGKTLNFKIKVVEITAA
jgi:FKBP-type peptidyl-prolyl cis-trans isomerase 2